MFMYIIDGFNWCADEGVQKVIGLIKILLEVVRYAIPIGLIVMTSLDVFKKVINPDEKEGQQKIIKRAIAAVLVFFVPVLIDIVMHLISVGGGNVNNGNVGNCWESIK